MGTYTPSPLGTLANEQAAVAKINENLTNIAAAMEGKLSRTDNNLPNHMSRDLDMNSHDLLNVGAIFADRVVATEPPPDPFGNSEFVNYTPQGSGAVQRTVQDKLREVVSVRDFGAVGDGATDDTGAFEALANYVNTLNTSNGIFDQAVPAFIPPGRYRITRQITFTRPVSIFGNGRSASVLEYYGGPTSALFRFVADATVGYIEEFSVSELGMRACVVNAGTAIRYEGQNVASSNFPNIRIKGVHIWSDFGVPYWAQGIDVSNAWHLVVEDCFIKGASNSAANWLAPAIRIGTKTIDLRINNTFIYNAATAVQITGGDAEGVTITNCSFVAVQRGVDFTVGTTPPMLIVDNSHIACTVGGIRLNGMAQVHITNNLFYHGDILGSQTPNNAVTVDAATTNFAVYHGNIFVRQSTSATGLTGIRVANSGWYLITNNVFDGNVSDGYATGISIPSGTVEALVSSNTFRNVTTRVSNSSSTVRVFDPEFYRPSWAVSHSEPVSGGASKTISVPVPAGFFTTKPVAASCLEASGVDDIIGYYDHDNVATTGTNLVFKIVKRDATALPTGNIRLSIIAHA